MSKREDTESKAEKLLQPIVDQHGFELVDVEFVREGGHTCAFLCEKPKANAREVPLVSAELVERLDRRYWETLDAFFQAPAESAPEWARGEDGR